MGCCQCQGIEKMFDKKTALKELKKYHKKGPSKTTRMLLEAIEEKGIQERHFMDIGGGVGAIQFYLLEHGAVKGTSIDASQAYLDVAQEEAEKRGLADKIVYQHGDFTTVASDSDQTDIITLDRVICCYDDVLALVGLSSKLAKKVYGVVYLRDTWWVKLARPILNLYPKIMGSPFRVFVHPTKLVEDIIKRNGLKRYFYGTTAIWQVAVFAR